MLLHLVSFTLYYVLVGFKKWFEAFLLLQLAIFSYDKHNLNESKTCNFKIWLMIRSYLVNRFFVFKIKSAPVLPELKSVKSCPITCSFAREMASLLVTTKKGTTFKIASKTGP